MAEISEKPILLLVDGHSLAFRSFYAFSKGGEGGLTTKEGIPTSVTYGFLKSLLDNCKQLRPEGVTIAFDTGEPTFRHKSDPSYKANRDVAPESFFQDLKQLQKILQKDLNLPICTASSDQTIDKESYEADDVLGTLANRASKKGWRVRILTGDRDLFQLVNDEQDIAVMYMGGGPYAKSGNPLLINELGVQEKLGVSPNKVVDLKALTGDSSDNIPGVKGVGPKTAINLLKENGDLDGVYSSLKELEKLGESASKGCIKGALKTKLRNDKDNAYLSKDHAEIRIEIPFKIETRFELEKVNVDQLEKSLEELELTSLIRQIPIFDATFSSGGLSRNNIQIDSNKNSFHVPNRNIIKTKENLPAKNKIPKIIPKIINEKSQLETLVKKLIKIEGANNPVAIDTETTDLNPFRAELVGIGICWGSDLTELAYIPIGHKSQGKIFNDHLESQLSLDFVLSCLSPWLSSEKHSKVLQNTKYDRLIFIRHGISLQGVTFDTLLADYLLDSSSKHSLEEIAKREFDFEPTKFNDIVEKGKNFSDVSIDIASLYCGMDVYLTRRLSIVIKDKLEAKGDELINLLKDVEQPLESVLAQMENTGIRIDIKYLESLSKSFKKTLTSLEKNIHAQAGTKFNLNSPKQLAEILFNTLGLDKRKSRKTKTGWSTDASILDKLKSDHPVITQLIEHRTISKLLSTYVEALPLLVEKETLRVHTDFNQAITATGRLSSSSPNLQNIPIRTESSRRIRKAFLPKENWKLLSADYSQIELRILAHLSKEEALQNAFKNREDVHTLTAKILLEKESINSEERRLGKTINFGVIYGMGAQRFARAAGVSQLEAKDFLMRFKQRYTKVFSFLELQEKLALSQGFVKTLLGRRRYFHFDKNGLGRMLGKNVNDIDLNLARRAGIEAQQLRAAANAPIQGSSADIIKVAMVQLNQEIKRKSYSANILLQVHDELVLEVDTQEVEEVRNLVVSTMEKAVKLSIPLLVETGIGDNWMDCK